MNTQLSKFIPLFALLTFLSGCTYGPCGPGIWTPWEAARVKRERDQDERTAIASEQADFAARPVLEGTAEDRRTAEACLQLVHLSPRGSELRLKPDDPRLPEAIRALHPANVLVGPRWAIVVCRSNESLIEYRLTASKTSPGTWRLFISDKETANEQREVCRIGSK